MSRNKVLMTTKKIIAQDAIYHITQRAPGRELVFVEDSDYTNFLHLLENTSREYLFDILCFALLPNHLHILLKTNEENLNQGMKHLFQSYAQRFNKKYQRKGHVFCGVYRASLCQDDAYLIAASLYIHLNTYKAGIDKNPFECRWCSLAPYIKNVKYPLIKTSYILDIIDDKDKTEARKIYKKMIEDNSKIELKTILQNSNAVRDFFDNFILWFKNNIGNIKLRRRKAINFYIDLEEALRKIRGKKRFGNLESKKALIYLIEQLKAHGYSDKEIADKLQIGRSTVYRLTH